VAYCVIVKGTKAWEHDTSTWAAIFFAIIIGTPVRSAHGVLGAISSSWFHSKPKAAGRPISLPAAFFLMKRRRKAFRYPDIIFLRKEYGP